MFTIHLRTQNNSISNTETPSLRQNPHKSTNIPIFEHDDTTASDGLRGAQIKGIVVHVYPYNYIRFSVAFNVCRILSEDRPVLILQSC